MLKIASSFRFIQVCLFVCAVVLVAAAPVVAQSRAVLTLSSTTILVGESATIEAQLDCGVVRCTSFSITLQYDPELLHVNDLVLGEYLGDAAVVTSAVDNEIGVLRFAAVTLGLPQPVTSDLLFQIDVTALAAGSVQITASELTIGDLESLPASLNGGIIGLRMPIPTALPPTLVQATSLPEPTATLPSVDYADLRIAYTHSLDLYLWESAAQNSQLLSSNGDSYEPDIFQNQVVFPSARDGNRLDIYSIDLLSRAERRLTADPAQDRHPVFSPDGTKIAFTSDRSGNWEIYVMNADGSNVIDVTNSPAQEYFPSWSSDGRQLVFQSDRSGKYEYEQVDLQSGNRSQLTHSDVNLVAPSLSPDGQWIVGYANVDPIYWVLVRVSDGTITPGQAGTPTDWLDAQTFVYHRKADNDPNTYNVYAHNIVTDAESILVPNGTWAAVD